MRVQKSLGLFWQVTTLLLCCFNRVHAGEPSSEPILRIETGMHIATIRRIATDAQSRYLVTASDDKTARIWDIASGKLLSTLRPPQGVGKEGMLYAVAMSPDGNTVALGGWTDDDNSAYLFDRASGRLLHRLSGLPEVIFDLAWSPDGRWLAAGLSGKSGVRVYRSDTWQQVGSDSDYDASSFGVDFSRDGRLVSCSFDGLLRLYALNEQGLRLLAKQGAPGGKQPVAVSFSPDGLKIAVGFYDTPQVNVLDGSTLDHLFTPGAAGANGESLGAVSWSADGNSLYAGGGRGAAQDFPIRRWPEGGRGAVQDLPGSDNTLNDLRPLPDGGLLFGSYDPSWGMLSAKGERTRWIKGAAADFRNNKQGLRLSRDGMTVGFSYEVWGKSPARFDLQAGLSQGVDTALGLPHINAPGLDIADWNTSSPKLNGTPLKLTQNEQSRSVAIAPDSNSFALGADWSLRLFDRNGAQLWSAQVQGVVWAVNISDDGRYVVAALGDGTIRWYGKNDGKEVLAFFPHADKKRWILWTPEGYYDASPGGEDLIGWHLNQGNDKEARFIPSGQLYDVFFRPDIVLAKFRGDDISSLITLTAVQALKNPPPILSFTRIPSTTQSNTEKVCYKAIATGGGIGEVRLFQNGKLIKSDGFYRENVAKADNHIKLASVDSAAVTRSLRLTQVMLKSEPAIAARSKGETYEECQNIETIPGENEISVAAFNATNTVQSKLETVSFTSNRQAEEPHLYVLGIGINQYAAAENNLAYAVKDATDFRTMIQAKAKGLYKEGNIHIEGLSDAQATKAGIQQAIATIATKVKPWDSFILFVASHGYLQDNQYYIVTADFDGIVNTANMISSNEIVGMSKNIKSLSQLLIFDTCHAGGVDNIIGGLYDARMSVMAKKMGLHIYASAGSTQTARDGYQGNGLFTHALLDSMKTADTTDSNGDKEVSVAELGERAKQETLDISTKLGSPQSPNIINFGKDNALFRMPGFTEKLSIGSIPAPIPVTATVKQAGDVFKDCADCPQMVVIPAGSFDMGSNSGSGGYETPVRRVTFAKSFALGKTEITQGQWKALMGSNPSSHSNCGDTCPVEKVNWNDAKKFIQRLNAKTGEQYRLPSEAEWEYACRAGGKHEYCGSDNLDSVAWYSGNSGDTTHPSAQKQANAFGLYDMSGNVFEWVEDSFNGRYNGAPTDGTVWQGISTKRVLRGGSWGSESLWARSASRYWDEPAEIAYFYGNGFRLAKTLPSAALATALTAMPKIGAADDESAEAVIKLAETYWKGDGVPKDYAKALELLSPLAIQGNAKAQNRLATLYMGGPGVTQDYAQAIVWFNKSAAQGLSNAQSNLGGMYFYGNGVPQDYAIALELYLKAAAQGIAQAQIQLGDMYLNGIGVTRDYAKAFEWHQKAAVQGWAISQAKLGTMYYSGEGVPQDYEKSIEWFQKAANQGNASAQFFLGYMYDSGKGVTQDREKALEWIQKSAAQGNENAIKALDQIKPKDCTTHTCR